jgi:myosin-1
MGDYLDVNGKSPLGEELSQVCSIGSALIFSLASSSVELFPGDQVTFSGRIQLLVSKLGRSSKPSPRFIVVVRNVRL